MDDKQHGVGGLMLGTPTGQRKRRWPRFNWAGLYENLDKSAFKFTLAELLALVLVCAVSFALWNLAYEPHKHLRVGMTALEVGEMVEGKATLGERLVDGDKVWETYTQADGTEFTIVLEKDHVVAVSELRGR
jgi:hypothetical protein